MESIQPLKTSSEEATPVDGNADNAETLDAVTNILGVDPTAKPVHSEKEEPGTLTEAIVELAADESPPDGGESPEPIKTPKNLEELAKRLKVEVKDLYDIEFPDPQTGESHTLGKLKDLLATNSDLTGRELQIEERRVTAENEQVQARADLEEILKALPPEAVSPEILAKAREQREAYLDREASRVLDVIPEWSNADTKREEWKAVQEHMADYGYTPSQVDQIADHQMVRYMRDNMRRKTLVDKALSTAKPVKKVAKSTSAKPTPPAKPVTATPQSSLNEQLAAVDKLLK